MYLAFLEASYAAFMIQSYYACDLGFPSIFASTVYWNTAQSWEEQKLQSAHVLAQAGQFWTIFLWMTIVFQHLTVMIDVIKRLRSPMKVSHIKVWHRLLINIVLLFFVCFWTID